MNADQPSQERIRYTEAGLVKSWSSFWKVIDSGLYNGKMRKPAFGQEGKTNREASPTAFTLWASQQLAKITNYTDNACLNCLAGVCKRADHGIELSE